MHQQHFHGIDRPAWLWPASGGSRPADWDDAIAFRTLNEEWIARYFALEADDIETLGDPQTNILGKGGSVFMAYYDSLAVGCIALIPFEKGLYEVSKMAVDPQFRGRGFGRRLLLYAIAQARQVGATAIFLGTNTRLRDAAHLYESVGFRHVPPTSVPPSPYARADMFMQMTI